MTKQVARSHQRLASAALCGLLVLAFVGAGIVKLIPIEFERTSFQHFGYAPWFMTLVGLGEIGGALLLLLPRTRVLGSLFLAAVMVGAVGSHLRAGDGFGMATPAFILFVLLLVMAFVSRAGTRAVGNARAVQQSA